MNDQIEVRLEKELDRHIDRQYGDLGASTRFISRKPCAGIIIEFAPNMNGQMAGAIDVYLSEAVGGYPYRTLNAGNVYAMPLEAPQGAVVTVVPRAGAAGTAIVTLTSFEVQPFIGTV